MPPGHLAAAPAGQASAGRPIESVQVSFKTGQTPASAVPACPLVGRDGERLAAHDGHDFRWGLVTGVAPEEAARSPGSPERARCDKSGSGRWGWRQMQLEPQDCAPSKARDRVWHVMHARSGSRRQSRPRRHASDRGRSWRICRHHLHRCRCVRLTTPRVFRPACVSAPGRPPDGGSTTDVGGEIAGAPVPPALLAKTSTRIVSPTSAGGQRVRRIALVGDRRAVAPVGVASLPAVEVSRRSVQPRTGLSGQRFALQGGAGDRRTGHLPEVSACRQFSAGWACPAGPSSAWGRCG
jgi:hypothetical protein